MPSAFRILVSATVLALAAGSTVAKPRRPPPPAGQPVAALGLRPAISLIPQTQPSLPPPMVTGGAFKARALAANGLAASGLHSVLPPSGDPAVQCRDTCAHTRIVCDSQDAGPECTSRWSMCVADCSH